LRLGASVVLRAAIRSASDVGLAACTHDARVAARPKRILLGFDGTDGARRALAAAAQLMGYGSTMTVVRVRPDGASPDETNPLDTARDLLLRELVAARYLDRVGDPADEIVALARDIEADVIVVGRRGPSERNGAGPGSVSADVVAAAARAVRAGG
jgi:nucleotide-binding universal stress UspA family protein